MSEQNQIDYQRIEKAITYIHDNFKSQPRLSDIATVTDLSPFHFQRLFSEWAGVSPKKFVQYLSLDYAKSRLRDTEASLLQAASDTGLSGTGRLHDLFINIEGMTPGEFKSGGRNLCINYHFATSPFGNVIVASTSKGVCHMSFENNAPLAVQRLKRCFPNATYREAEDRFQHSALLIFRKNWSCLADVKLHLAATPFQLKVWESLLKIPAGTLASYSNIAQRIGKPTAARAVGSAIASNPVAYLIPCHRVIQRSGQLGGYMWGTARKSAIIAWEASHNKS